MRTFGKKGTIKSDAFTTESISATETLSFQTYEPAIVKVADGRDFAGQQWNTICIDGRGDCRCSVRLQIRSTIINIFESELHLRRFTSVAPVYRKIYFIILPTAKKRAECKAIRISGTFFLEMSPSQSEKIRTVSCIYSVSIIDIVLIDIPVIGHPNILQQTIFNSRVQ